MTTEEVRNVESVNSPCTALLRRQRQHPLVTEDATFKEFHNVKRRSNDRVIFAQDIRTGDWNTLVGGGSLVVGVQRLKHLEFAFDLVCSC